MGYRRYVRGDGDEVTSREILFSIIIILVVIVFGIWIVSSVQNVLEERNEVYYKAVKIDNNGEMFNYAQKTDAGNALVYGLIKAVDTVSIPEINSEFMYIERVKEKYTMHTRTVTSTDSNGKTTTRTETYWTWDYSGKDVYRSNELEIFNNVYETNKFGLGNLVTGVKLTKEHFVPTPKYTKLQGSYVYEDSHTRYYYEGIPIYLNGNFFVKFVNNTINPVESKKIEIYYGTIEQRIEKLEKSVGVTVIVIWVIIGLITLVGIVLFVKEYHPWLERG